MEKGWEVWDDAHTKNIIKHSWGRKGYDKRYLTPMYRKAACLIEGTSVLDVGCGLGQLISHLPKQVSYIGIDNSSSMLQVARKRYPDYPFVLGDVHSLSQFGMRDTVIALNLLMHLPKIERPIVEMWNKTNKCLIFSMKIGNRSSKEHLQHIHFGSVCSKFPDGKFLIIHTETLENIHLILRKLRGIEITEKYHVIEHIGMYLFKIKRGT